MKPILMKKLKSIMAAITLLALVATPALIVGCKHWPWEGHRDSHAHYSCPTHSDYVQEHPGTCPRCGTRLTNRY